MENEESIDLGRLMQILWERRKNVGGVIVGCTTLALIVSFALPKTYESTTLVQTRSAGKDVSGMAAMAAAMGISTGSSSAGSPLNYIEMMKSRTVLDPIIEQMEWPEDKKPEAKDFAKENLKIENTKQTNLITVTATGKSPEEAQMISKSVVENFLTLQTDMNQQTQSLLIKFLDERIVTAKQDSEDAAAKLAAYSKEHKLYSPDEQEKFAIAQLDAYDKAIGDLEVQKRSAQAAYDTATAKLGEQKSGAKAYHINDNSTVQNIRSQIVSAQVDLVSLREKYTEEHPSVIQAKKKLNSLNQALVDEVNSAVDSNAATLNPAYAELFKNQAISQAQASAASASEEAVKEKKAAKEKELGDLPEAVMNYMQLSSDSKVKQEIYLNLLKQCEQNKIQEAMEAMDIQVIDPANLPDEDKPAGPRKLLITAIGFIIGCLLSFGYGIVQYKREEA